MTLLPFFFSSQTVNVDPELRLVYTGWAFYFTSSLIFPLPVPFFNGSPLSKALLQGEQCNIIPDNVDDIVADLAPEEKDEGALFPFVASGNLNWPHLLGKQFANMF